MVPLIHAVIPMRVVDLPSCCCNGSCFMLCISRGGEIVLFVNPL